MDEPAESKAEDEIDSEAEAEAEDKGVEDTLKGLYGEAPEVKSSPTTLRAGSIEHKKTFVMKHPPQMRFNPPT